MVEQSLATLVIRARKEWARVLRSVADGELTAEEGLFRKPVIPVEAEVPKAWGSAVITLEQEREHRVAADFPEMAKEFSAELRRLASRIDVPD